MTTMAGGDKERLTLAAIPATDPEIGRLLWMLEDGRRRTKELLDDAPEDALFWALAPGANSIGTLLYHIAAIEADWLYTEALDQAPIPPEIVSLFSDDVRDDEGRLTVSGETSLGMHLDRLDAVRGALLDAFGRITRDDFRRERRLPDYDVTPEWVLHHLIQHEAEHRGEIGMIRTCSAAE